MGEGDRDSGGRGPRQRHIKLIAEGDTFPLSESEHNPSTQPAAVRCAPFFKNCGGAATTTLSGEAAVKLKNPPAAGRSILRTFLSQPFYTTCLRQQATTCGEAAPPLNPLNPGPLRGPYFMAPSIVSRFSLMVSR